MFTTGATGITGAQAVVRVLRANVAGAASVGLHRGKGNLGTKRQGEMVTEILAAIRERRA